MHQASARQLLNTSWTVHRLSPLHHGKEFQSLLNNPSALQTYATRLRDQLTGDALAGLQVAGAGADDGDALSKTGALKMCTWESISESRLEDSSVEEGESQPGSRGILVVLEYENTTYKAALLAEQANATATAMGRKGSTVLPLLLTRLSPALRQTFTSFLSTNFDAYCSLLRLPSNFLWAGLDTYVDTFLSDDATSDLQAVVKDVQLTLSFSPSVAPALRSLNVTIPRASFGEFIRDPSPVTSDTSPFLSNFSAYLDKHLAMNLDLGVLSSVQRSAPAKQHARVSKISCGGFVLGSEGRIKLAAAGDRDNNDNGPGTLSAEARLEFRASEALLETLVRRAVAGSQIK